MTETVLNKTGTVYTESNAQKNLRPTFDVRYVEVKINGYACRKQKAVVYHCSAMTVSFKLIGIFEIFDGILTPFYLP